VGTNIDISPTITNETSTVDSRQSTTMLDRSIKATGDDAMVAKLATTQAGYYVDPFLDAFCQSSNDVAHNTPIGRSPVLTSRAGAGQTRNGRRRTVQPIIKRGTHARVCVIDRALSGFLKMMHELPAAACQVVVLGAGKDTSYFRYRNGNLMGMQEQEDETKIEGIEPIKQQQQQQQQQHMHNTNQHKVHWYEVDHVSVIKEKASLVRKSNLLKSFCPLLVKTASGYECVGASKGLSFSDELKSSSSTSTTYHLVGHDLRDSPTILLEKLSLNPSLPTLFIMECVSMYIPITESKSLLQALSVSTDTVFIACYEPILGSGDQFGRVMERNLLKMGVASPECCLLQTRTLKDQLEKLVECKGFLRAVGCDMWSAYETIVTEAQRKRASQSEFMDEYEEWILIMRHYCFVVAQGGRSSSQQTQSTSSLTTVQGPNGNDKTSSSLGWVSGKCLQLEKPSE
jgi:O-methyltransferase involved in polyketide biosynthesis